MALIKGTEKNDYLNGTDYSDSIYGYAGSDRLYGKKGNDYIYGGDGFDLLHGGAGNDYLYGGKDTDYLYGRKDSDRLYGGDNNDYLYGGPGKDYMDGGSGYDIAYYSDHEARIVADLKTDTVEVIEYTGDTSTKYTETIKNIEGVVGSNRGNDILYGDDYNNTLAGRKGNDRLYGRGGDDNLYGEDGNDVLEGGYGKDILMGGQGLDIFKFNNKHEGVDNIIDFSESDSDYIQVSKVGFGASSKNQFSYNSHTGELSFDASPYDGVAPTVFAVLSNKPNDFSINRAIQLV